tara:strand:- start:5884 stop:6708 length:825 start_codon:yes stop_codon:yes gene_type:complete
MSDNESVITESLPVESDGPHDIEGLMVDALRAEADEGSSFSATPSVEGEVGPATNEQNAEADTDAEASEVEATAESDKEEELIPKASFLKRVNGLTAARRRLERENLESKKEISEYREAFQILADRVRKAEGKLADYEEVDPREQRILDSERQKQAEEIREKLNVDHQRRLKAMEQKVQVEHRADQIVENAHKLAEKYGTITPEELVYKFRGSKQTLEALAKSMHKDRYKQYKDMFAKENKPRAPKTVKPQGGMATIKGTSEDDMADFLSTMRS